MISNLFRIIISSVSIIYTFYVLRNLVYFLSHHHSQNNDYKIVLEEESHIRVVIWPLLVDSSLLGIFILQHSLMASNEVKNLYSRLNVSDIERCIYNICTSATLHLVLMNWQSVQSIYIWKISISNNTLWFAFVTLHTVCWFIIYGSCFTLDISEFIGLKQICNRIFDKRISTVIKSQEFERYLKHMRHPSLTAFSLILWVYPLMSIDRLFCAIILTIYMALIWNVDKEDYYYHLHSVKSKYRQLS